MSTHKFLTSARGRIVDDLLVLKAKGTVATSMVGEDPVGTDTYIDVGGGRTRGDMVVNVYAVPNLVAGADFKMKLQGAKSSSFATPVDLVTLPIGDAGGLAGGDDIGAGRYVVPFTNELDDTIYRYLRHYITCGGTVGTGIQYEVYLSKLAG